MIKRPSRDDDDDDDDGDGDADDDLKLRCSKANLAAFTSCRARG